MRSGRAVRVLCCLAAVLPLLIGGAAPAAVDLAGKWRHQDGTIVAFTQVGDAVTFPRMMGVFGTIPTTVTITAPGDVGYPGGNLRLHPGEEVFQNVWVGIGGPTWDLFTRCACDDGNAADGDGCDSQCRIEPCFTCSGDPSSCTPTADGGACDDHSICTTGETCTGGICGGTAIPGCLDLSGEWSLHQNTSLGIFWDEPLTIEQRGNLVIFRTPGGVSLSGPHWVGTLDVLSGALSLALPPEFPCPLSSTLPGSATATSFTASGTQSNFTGPTGAPCLTFTVSMVGSRLCGNGAIDTGETCDDGGLGSGDGCDASCQVEPCWSCIGTPSICAPLGATPCDDGDACTTGETCATGTCEGGTAVDCGACLGCESASGCVAAPRDDCRAAGKSALQIADAGDASGDAIKWRWLKGAATTLSELGDPTDATGAALCVFDESGPTPSLLFRAELPAGGTCGTRPCWKSTAAGFTYRDAAGGADGITNLVLRGGTAGKAKVLLKGKGAGLSSRPFALPAPPLDLPLRAQLQLDGAACFESALDGASVRRNQPGAFKALRVP